MKTQLPATSKTKKVWQKPTLTVMSSTQQIQGGGSIPGHHEVGHANGTFYLAPDAYPGNKFSTPVGGFNRYHS